MAAAAAVVLQSLEPHHQHRRKHANASKDLRVTFAVATRDDDDDDDGVVVEMGGGGMGEEDEVEEEVGCGSL